MPRPLAKGPIENFRAVHEEAFRLVRQMLQYAGYTDAAPGIDPDRCEVQVQFNGPSQDIN